MLTQTKAVEHFGTRVQANTHIATHKAPEGKTLLMRPIKQGYGVFVVTEAQAQFNPRRWR